VVDVRFPNESEEYRKARNELLEAELALRAQVERIAEQRRQLPPGGELKEDYLFDELVDGQVRQTRFSDLFAPRRDTLFVYSFMYAPHMDAACPMCSAFLDGLDAQIPHIDQNISTAVVAKHDIHTIHEHAMKRRWRNLRLLSSGSNSYNADYLGEVDGRQIGTTNVFLRDGDAIRHFWNSEVGYAPSIKGGDMRHLDLVWPLWGVLDMTPQGRGQWYPSLDDPQAT